jgi:putative membrane protein
MLTTASDRVMLPFRHNRLLQGLAALFAIAWLVGAIAPMNRFDWFLENLLVFVAAGLLVHFYRTRPLSDLSYTLITIFLLLHTVGAHYTYSKVPLGFWLEDALALERNHFDRVIHFSFGVFIVYPVREVLFRYSGAGLRLSEFAAFTVIATSSAVYEIIEWIVAVIVSPEAAMAYLGTQGDTFDAQKDSVLAIAGAFLGLVLTRRFIKLQQAE